MLKIYRVLWLLFLPLISIFIKIRVYLGKENKNRVGEKFGVPGVKRPNKKIIWIHAASVGESLSALIFIKYFPDAVLEYPHWNHATQLLQTSSKITSLFIGNIY